MHLLFLFTLLKVDYVKQLPDLKTRGLNLDMIYTLPIVSIFR